MKMQGSAQGMNALCPPFSPGPVISLQHVPLTGTLIDKCYKIVIIADVQLICCWINAWSVGSITTIQILLDAFALKNNSAPLGFRKGQKKSLYIGIGRYPCTILGYMSINIFGYQRIPKYQCFNRPRTPPKLALKYSIL